MPRRPALRSRPLVRPLAALLVCFQECSLAGIFHFQNPVAISIVWFPPPSYPGPRVHCCASHWRERLGSNRDGGPWRRRLRPLLSSLPVRRDLLWEQQAALTPSQPWPLSRGPDASGGLVTQTPFPREQQGHSDSCP